MVIREGAAQIVLDADGDGKGDIDWPTKGKFENLVLEPGSGDTKRKWAVLTEVGRQEDFYQGQPMNLLATDGRYLVYCIPGGCMKGTVSGETIRSTTTTSTASTGRLRPRGSTSGSSPVTLSSSSTPSASGRRRSRPFSSTWTSAAPGGTRSRPRTRGPPSALNRSPSPPGRPGEGKGVKPEYYVLRGVDDSFKKTFIDVSGGKKVDVPAGRWELAFGSSGRARRCSR